MPGMQSAFGCTGAASGVCNDDEACGVPDGAAKAELIVSGMGPAALIGLIAALL